MIFKPSSPSSPPSDSGDDPSGPLTPEGVGARQYGDVASIYDTLMLGVPHSAWLNRIERAVAERGKKVHSALDVACGTGLVTTLLYRRGYRPVVGVDLSAAMIAIAQTKAQARHEQIVFLVQDAARLDLHGQTFDLAVSLFDSLNYILDPGALQQAFVQVFRHVTPGGVFAFDMNSLYALSNDLFTQRTDYGQVRHDWKAYWDRETRLCRVEMAFWVADADSSETRHFTETHVQRAYTVPELTEWLQAAGFANVQCFGNYGDRPPTARSDRLLFVSERPA